MKPRLWLVGADKAGNHMSRRIFIRDGHMYVRRPGSLRNLVPYKQYVKTTMSFHYITDQEVSLT